MFDGVDLGGWTHWSASALAAFSASLVECVEALTIVLAVGITRGWRSDPPPINESGSGVILDQYRTLFMEEGNGAEEVHSRADHRAFAAC